jgi:hypothetical protein
MSRWRETGSCRRKRRRSSPRAGASGSIPSTNRKSSPRSSKLEFSGAIKRAGSQLCLATRPGGGDEIARIVKKADGRDSRFDGDPFASEVASKWQTTFFSDHVTRCKLLIHNSKHPDSNRGPTDYKSVAEQLLDNSCANSAGPREIRIVAQRASRRATCKRFLG